jgi:hypothetical protein
VSSLRRLPGYAIAGLLAMAVSEVFMIFRTEPFWSWHTPIAWTGYILFVDGLVRLRRGSSWLSAAAAEFAFLAALSFPLWLVFEGYNLLIRNWHYVNLPESWFWRNLGYVWSFGTIWPAIFETADLVEALRREKPAARQKAAGGLPRRVSAAGWLSILVGIAMLAWPLVRPSPYLAAPVFLGFIFVLDPINARFGGEALWADCQAGRWNRGANLAVAGLLCGLLWEFWNYWARTKWIYSVPIFEHLKLFEMPLPGYLGFPAFALECFAMYVSARLLFWRGRSRPIALSSPGRTA